MRNPALPLLSTCLAAAVPVRAVQLAGASGRGVAPAISVPVPGADFEARNAALSAMTALSPDLSRSADAFGRSDPLTRLPDSPTTSLQPQSVSVAAPAAGKGTDPGTAQIAAPPRTATRPSPAAIGDEDRSATALPEEGGGGSSASNPPALSALNQAAAGKLPAGELYDRYGRRLPTVDNDAPIFHSFLHGRRAGEPEGAAEVRPPDPPAAISKVAQSPPEAGLPETIDALEKRVPLGEAQRGALADAAQRARAARDLDLLAALTFLSLHDPLSKGILTASLRAMPLDPDARQILAQENRFMFEPITEEQRREMASRARAVAARYAASGVVRPPPSLGL